MGSCGMFTVRACLLWLIVLLTLFYICVVDVYLVGLFTCFLGGLTLLRFVILVYWLFVDLRLRFAGLLGFVWIAAGCWVLRDKVCLSLL